MLDKLNKAIIKVLNDLCGGSSYKILEISEVIDKLAKFSIDYEILNNNLHYLQERQYIDIKYIDEKEVCLALLPKARIHSEEEEEEVKKKISYYKLAIITSICSVIGAFIGGFLAGMIF